MPPKLRLTISKADLLWIIAALGIISDSIIEDVELESTLDERAITLKNYTYQCFLEKVCINLLNKFIKDLRKQDVTISLNIIQAFTLFEFLQDFEKDFHLSFEPQLHQFLFGKHYPFKGLIELSKQKIDYYGAATLAK